MDKIEGTVSTEELVEGGGDGAFEFSYCALPEVPQREFGPEVAPMRLALIQLFGKKWVNGTELRYYFFDEERDGEFVRLSNGQREWRTYQGSEEQQEVVRRGFQAWKDLGIGLEFQEVDDRGEAEIRIGFMQGDGSWSYVGREIIDLGLSVNERTMNFGWDLTRNEREIDTAIHEIGHTMGFPHEHQNPNAGIEWDEEAVYRALGRPPNNWSRQKTFHNIIRKIDPDTVQGSSWDPDSIMHYPFPAGLIRRPEEYRNGIRPAGGLSERDRQWVLSFYPALEPAYPELEIFSPEFLSITPGDQMNLSIRPERTRDYTLQTFGTSDTVMVLFERVAGELRYLDGDDDSGLATNALIKQKLFRGREYVLRVRLYYSGGAGKTAVMMW